MLKTYGFDYDSVRESRKTLLSTTLLLLFLNACLNKDLFFSFYCTHLLCIQKKKITSQMIPRALRTDHLQHSFVLRNCLFAFFPRRFNLPLFSPSILCCAHHARWSLACGCFLSFLFFFQRCVVAPSRSFGFGEQAKGSSNDRPLRRARLPFVFLYPCPKI